MQKKFVGYGLRVAHMVDLITATVLYDVTAFSDPDFPTRSPKIYFMFPILVNTCPDNPLEKMEAVVITSSPPHSHDVHYRKNSTLSPQRFELGP